MVKPIIQDVVPPRRSIRQIVVPGNQAGRDTMSSTSMPPPPISEFTPTKTRRLSGYSPPMSPPPLRDHSRQGMWIVAGIALIFLYLAFAVFFAGATVLVTPREQNTTINGLFIAKQDPLPLELSFETMSISAENRTAVPATGEKYVEQKASGVITIFNDYNDQPLRLVKNTRFESPGGLIYRIANTVTVPPQKKTDGVSEPGSIDAEIYSDTAGAEFNIETALFTIPGLKDTPQFSGFYAKTKTPITGGYDGMMKVLDVTKETEARTTLQTQLNEQIRAQAQKEIPEGYVLFDGAFTIESTSLPNASTETESMVTVGEKVTLHGIIFNEAILAEYIARNTIPNFDNAKVHIPNLKTLTVAITTDDTTVKPWEVDMIQLSIIGNPSIVWDFEKDLLLADLVGKPKQEVNTVLGKHPGIAKAEVTVRPFWKKSFPKKLSKIKVIINGQEQKIGNVKVNTEIE